MRSIGQQRWPDFEPSEDDRGRHEAPPRRLRDHSSHQSGEREKERREIFHSLKFVYVRPNGNEELS